MVTMQDCLEKLKKSLDRLDNQSDVFVRKQGQRYKNLLHDYDNVLEQKIFAEQSGQEAMRLRNIEMNKSDQIQMELEVTRRERDLALRSQGLTIQQKQALSKLEHESYKISEALHRLEGITQELETLIKKEESN